jgi:mRNA interferase MazF
MDLVSVQRFEVYWVNLEPTQGSEIRKTWPCTIVSPDELNQYLNTVMIAPLTTSGKTYPTRIECTVAGKTGWVVLDQLRTVDTSRLGKRIGILDEKAADLILEVLQEMFSK